MNTTKRLYFYGVSFVTLVVAANGITLLIQFLLELFTQRAIAGWDNQASLGLSMVIVGAPLWILHWHYTQRQAAKHPEETASTLRKLYLYGVLFTASLVVFIAVHSILVGTMSRDGDFNVYFVGQALVWGIVWGYHWSMERRDVGALGSLTLKRWYTYGTSVYTLIVLFVGATGVFTVLFQWAYDSILNAPVISSDGVWNNTMQDGIVSLVTGGAWWGFHWFYLARDDVESTLRQVYLNLFAFLGGAITALAAIGAVLYTVIRWLLGGTELLEASDHFRVITEAVPFLFAGIALLIYHWQVLQDESRLLAGRLVGAKRSFGYIMSAIGLGTAAVGVPLIVGAIIGQILPESGDSIAGSEPVREQLAFALTTIIIGLPLWYWYWPRMQRTVQEGGAEERGALARRIYIYGVLGVLALAGIGSLIGFLTGLFNDLLRGDLTVDFLRNGRWMLGIIVVSGALLPYHWRVLREDQREGGEPVPNLKSVTLLAGGESANELAKQLKEGLGVRVRLMRAVDESGVSALSDEQMEALLESIASVDAERLLVVVAEGQVKVHGYR